MKILIKLILFFCTWTIFMPLDSSAQGCYQPEYVEISLVNYKNQPYHMVTMRRGNNRVNALYFAAKDFNGNSVYQRFRKWKQTNPNIILISSGTYMDQYYNPQGLTIDNGIVVNQNLIHGKMDALAIVYATGGIAVSNLEEGNLSVSHLSKSLNLRNSAHDFDLFIEWAKDHEATVFQTHLLIYKNRLKIDPITSSKELRERRFLAVCKDEDDNIVHVIIQNPTSTTLYNGSKKILNFLTEFKDMKIIFMINLDTGAQDVFELHDSDCSINKTIKGPKDLSKAVNLLVYYFR